MVGSGYRWNSGINSIYFWREKGRVMENELIDANDISNGEEDANQYK